MSKIVGQTAWPATTGLSLLAIVALVIIAPGYTGLCAGIEDTVVGHSYVLVTYGGQQPALPLGRNAQDNMASNGKAGDTQPSQLVLPPLLKPDNSDKRLRKQSVSHLGMTLTSICRKRPSAILTSTSLISSHLGRRLRLVGARPSGTS